MENFSLEKVSTNYKEIIKYIDELLKSLEKEDCCNPGNVTVARYKIYDYLQNSWKKLCSRLRETDNVNHPKHYTSHPSGIECIDIAKYYDFCTGNAIKYLWRAGLKKDASLDDKQKEIEDLEKAVWYINKKIDELKK